MGDREDVLGPGQALEGMRPDVDQGGTVRELLGHQLGGRPRQQDLAALPERPQPGRAVERLPEIVLVAQLGLAGVQGGPGREHDRFRPPLPVEGQLQGQGRGHRVAGPGDRVESPSPWVLMTRPPRAATVAAISSWWRARAAPMAAP